MSKNYFFALSLCIALYLSFGLVLLTSACEGNYYMVYKQLLHIVLALMAAFSMTLLSSRQLQLLSFLVYVLGNILLIMVLLIGYTGKGAQRWLDLGVVRFEPSEILKIALPLCIASLAEFDTVPIRRNTIYACLILIAIPFLLIAKQPDLGTASITALIGIATMLIAGFPLRYFGYGIVFFVGCSPMLWHLLHDYQKNRILTLLMPHSDVSGTGYHIMQAKIAIGSGGILGKGWIQGTQTHLQYLPEQNTDFIFALCAEEFGFLGCLFLLLAFNIILWLCFRISTTAQDNFSRIACAGIGIAYALCTSINIAMVCGLIPVVGIPLPMISYGGTTMVITLFGFGIVLACAKQQRLFHH